MARWLKKLICTNTIALTALVAAAVDVSDPDAVWEINEDIEVDITDNTFWKCKLVGNGTITKLGSATLQVDSSNPDFTGNWIVRKGALKGGSKINTLTPFFGTGKIFVYASTTYNSRIEIYTSRIPNEIEVIGNSSADHPALYANAQSSFSGPITANGDLYVYQGSYAGGANQNDDKLKFEDASSIYASGQTVNFRPNARFSFTTATNNLVCETLNIDYSGTTKGYGSVYLAGTNSMIGTIRTCMAPVHCGSNNSFGGAALEWYRLADQTFNPTNAYYFYNLNNASRVTAAYLKSDECIVANDVPGDMVVNGYRLIKNKTGVGTLTLTGGVETATAYCRIENEINLKVANSGSGWFTQRLMARKHTMSGTLEVGPNSTLYLGAGTTFENVERITINGGKLEFEAGTNPFADEAISLSMSNGAKLVLPSGCTWTVKDFNLNGQPMDGLLGAGNVDFIEGEGALKAYVSEPTPETLTWVAENSDATVSTRANWNHSPLFDFEYPNKYVLYFAEANNAARAVVDADVRLAGLSFAAPTAQGFTLANENAAIELGSSGITSAVAEGSAQKYTIEPQITTSRPQTWTLGSNTTVKVTDAVINNQITLAGKGTIELAGTTTLNENIVNWGGANVTSAVKITEDLGRTVLVTDTVNGDGALRINGWNGCYIVLSNATINSRLEYGGDGSHDWAYGWFSSIPRTTNVINGAVSGSGACYFKLGSKSQLTINGGVTFGNKLSVNSQSTVIFAENPIQTTVNKNENNAFIGAYAGDSRMVFDVAGNKIPKLLVVGDNAVTEFRKDNVVSWECLTYYVNNGLDIVASSYRSAFEMNATRQQFRRINGDNPNTQVAIRGVYPSAIEVYLDSTNCSQITGWVALEKLSKDGFGEGTELVLKGKDFTSYGDLKVTDGTIKFINNATWQNGTNIVISGSGRVETCKSKTFGKQAILRIADEGVLSTPADSIQQFAQCWVEGEKIDAGIYTYETAPAALKAHLAPTCGTIKVGSMGLVLTIH